MCGISMQKKYPPENVCVSKAPRPQECWSLRFSKKREKYPLRPGKREKER